MTKFAFLAAVTSIAISGALMAQQTATPVSLVAAVQTAESRTGAGAFEAELEHEKGRAFYEISLAKGATLHQVTVDAKTGQVISATRPRFANMIPAWAGDDMPSKPKKIGSMLAKIERGTKGKVGEVSFDAENGAEVYEVEVSTNNGTAELHIDATTGKRLPVSYND